MRGHQHHHLPIPNMLRPTAMDQFQEQINDTPRRVYSNGRKVGAECENVFVLACAPAAIMLKFFAPTIRYCPLNLVHSCFTLPELCCLPGSSGHQCV